MTGPPSSESTPATSAARRVARLRLMAALALALLLFGIGRALDLQQHLTVESLRATMASAGTAGVVLYVIAFRLGELLGRAGNWRAPAQGARQSLGASRAGPARRAPGRYYCSPPAGADPVAPAQLCARAVPGKLRPLLPRLGAGAGGTDRARSHPLRLPDGACPLTDGNDRSVSKDSVCREVGLRVTPMFRRRPVATRSPT